MEKAGAQDRKLWSGGWVRWEGRKDRWPTMRGTGELGVVDVPYSSEWVGT